MRWKPFLYAGLFVAIMPFGVRAAGNENTPEIDFPAIGPATTDAHQSGAVAATPVAPIPIGAPRATAPPLPAVAVPAVTDTPATPAHSGFFIEEPKIPDLPRIASPATPDIGRIPEPKSPTFVIAEPVVNIAEPKLTFGEFGGEGGGGASAPTYGGALPTVPAATKAPVLAASGAGGGAGGGEGGGAQPFEPAQSGNVAPLPQVVSTPVLAVPSLPFFGNASTPVERIPTLPSTSAPIFGQATTPIAAPQNTFVFGTPSTPIRQTTSAPVFGTPSTPIQNPQTPYVFGRATTPTPSPLGTPNFGTPSTPLGTPSTPRQAPHTSPSLGVTSSPHSTPNLGVPSTPRGTR